MSSAQNNLPARDRDLEQHRNLLETPTEFKEGFGLTTVVGIVFCGLVMLPGSIYLGLMTGGSMGSAATWVTVILFSEIARRALKTLSKQQLVVLLHAAGAIMAGSALFPGGPFGNLVWRAYLVSSDAIRDAGMRDAFPSWWAPKPDSPAITARQFLHRDWLVPVAIMLAMSVIGLVNKYTLGYFFFRLTSDIERLPFPLAPINAQGAMAMAEAEENAELVQSDGTPQSALKRAGPKKGSERWRLFSLGAVIGIGFGLVQVGVPAVSGLFLEKPLFILPQPFADWTTLTESLLPATPTGMVIDLGIVLVAMVIPFWAIIGSFVAIAMTMIANPLLHRAGILTRWQPGMDTINTTFANSVDFWMSFGIGAGLGIAAVSIYQTVRDLRAKMREIRQQRSLRTGSVSDRPDPTPDLWATPQKGRGDYPLWIALAGYAATSAITIAICWSLLPKNFGILAFLLIFSFIYNPLISYVNARLLGIAGQTVDIPFVKETAFILSGARGVEIWLAPIPIENFGGLAQSFRVNELTGVSFWSLVKTDLVVLPIVFLLSFVFWAFIWASDAIPSSAFPAAQVYWELQSKNTALLYSSTYAGNIADSQFMQAIHPWAIGGGACVTIIIFAVLSALSLPVMLVYGMIRGMGGLPHTMLLEILGAMIGRFYMQKRFGPDRFLRMAPTLVAGYFTGVGLIGMATIAMKLIQTAVSGAPF